MGGEREGEGGRENLRLMVSLPPSPSHLTTPRTPNHVSMTISARCETKSHGRLFQGHTMPSKPTPIFLLTAFALSGCTHSPPSEQFTPVQQTITRRTGLTIHWLTHPP